jgi:hypothetical protein
MALPVRTITELPEYLLAPWHLKLRWWLLAGFWRLADLFAPMAEEAPEQQNALWRR